MYKENSRTELKEILNDKVKIAMSAFLNSQGGKIYVGVNDKGEIKGVDRSDQDKYDTKISSWLREAFFPNPTAFINYDFNKDNVLEITVKEGSRKPYYMQKKGPTPSGVYIRVGSSSRQANFDEITEMMINSSGKTYEDEVSSIQDLTFNELDSYNKDHGNNINLNRTEANGFINTDGLYTNLGFLFSDQNQHAVKFAVYENVTKNKFKVKKEFIGSVAK